MQKVNISNIMTRASNKSYITAELSHFVNKQLCKHSKCTPCLLTIIKSLSRFVHYSSITDCLDCLQSPESLTNKKRQSLQLPLTYDIPQLQTTY